MAGVGSFQIHVNAVIVIAVTKYLIRYEYNFVLI